MQVRSLDQQHMLYVEEADDGIRFSLDGQTRRDPTFVIPKTELRQLLRPTVDKTPLLTSKFDGWNTPAEVLDPLRAALGPIGLDPCSNTHSIVRAQVEWILARDGDSLPKPWSGYGLVYVNHPYAPGVTVKWAEKCAKEGRAGTELVQLCKATMGTKWFREHTRTADVILQWHGRLKHPGPTANGKLEPAPFESALAYWGPRPRVFMEAFKAKGDFVKTPFVTKWSSL